MRRLTDLDPGRRAAQERAVAFNANLEVAALPGRLDRERQMRNIAEQRLAERHRADSARFSQLATEQAMRSLGQEIGKRFADQLDRIGAKAPPLMDAKMVYHIAEQVFADNLSADVICTKFDQVLRRELGEHDPSRRWWVDMLRSIVEAVARERRSLWMLPREIQQWFYQVMELAEPHVEPHVRYVSRSDKVVDIQESIRVQVVWPRDVLAYDVTLGRQGFGGR